MLVCGQNGIPAWDRLRFQFLLPGHCDEDLISETRHPTTPTAGSTLIAHPSDAIVCLDPQLWTARHSRMRSAEDVECSFIMAVAVLHYIFSYLR